MADDQIQIKVSVDTGQGVQNTENLDKAISGLQKNVETLNKSLKDFSNSAKSTSDLDTLSKSIDKVGASMTKLGVEMKGVSGDKTPEILLPDNEKITKTIVGFQGLSSALKLFGGDIGGAIASVIQMGYALDALALNPVTITILAIAAALELMKSAYTDTIEGQDNLNVVMDEAKYVGNSYWEQLLNIGSAMKSFYYLITRQTEAYKKNNEELERNNHNLSGLSMKFIGEASLSQAQFVRQLGVSNLALRDFRDNTAITADAVNDMDYNIDDVIKKFDILKISQISASKETYNALTSGGDALKAQANVIEDLIPAAKKLNLIFLSKEKDGLYENISKAADIEGFIIENKKTLTNYQVEQLRIFEKISQKALDQQAKLAEQDKTMERLMKRNNQVITQMLEERQRAFVNTTNKMIEKDQLQIDKDKENSEDQFEHKLKLYDDEINAYKDRNNAIQKEITDLTNWETRLGLKNKKAHDALDKAFNENEHKKNVAIERRKKEIVAINKIAIKSEYDLAIAQDEFNELQAKDEHKRYEYRKKALEHELDEKETLMGLNYQQIQDLADEDKRNQMIREGIVTGEMLKAYTDYLLKIKVLDDQELERKKKKEKEEEDLLKQLAEFEKKGVAADADTQKKRITFDTESVKRQKTAIRVAAEDEIAVITAKEDTLTKKLTESLDSKLKAEGLTDEQIKTLHEEGGLETLKAQGVLNDQEIKQFQSLQDTKLDIHRASEEQRKNVTIKAQDQIAESSNKISEDIVATGDMVTKAMANVNEAIRGSFYVNKGIQEAEAVINTYGAATKAYNKNYSTIGPVDWAMKIAAVTATIAGGVAQINKIDATTPEGGKGGGVSIPSIPQAPNMFALGQGQIQNPTAFAANRVYVTEHDITSTQQRVKTVESGAVLGG